jgi:DNA-binding protein YbaB
VSSPLHDRIERAYAQFEEQRKALSQMQGRVAAVRRTVIPKSRVVSVTVDGGGEIVEIKFPTKAYRTMASAEFAQVLMDAVGEARALAREAATAELQALLPAGMPVLDALTRPVDIDELFERAGSPPGTADRDRSA